MKKKWIILIGVVVVFIILNSVIKSNVCYLGPDTFYEPNSILWFALPLSCGVHARLTSISIEPEYLRPSEAEPLIINYKMFDVNVTETKDIMIGFFNPTDSTENWIMEVIDDSGEECWKDNYDEYSFLCYDNIIIMYRDIMFNLPRYRDIGWYVYFKPNENAVRESEIPYQFTVQVCGKSDGTNISDCDEADIIHQEEFVMTVRR